MHQAHVVRNRQRSDHRLQVIQRRGGGEPALASDQGAQGAALNVLHHDVRSVGLYSLVEDCDDVGMGQPGRGPGLLVELGSEVDVVAKPLMHQLNRDNPAEPVVDTFEDGRHATAGHFSTQGITTSVQLTTQGVADSGRAHICSRHGWGRKAVCMAGSSVRKRW